MVWSHREVSAVLPDLARQLYLARHHVHGKPWSTDEEPPEKAFQWLLERNGDRSGVQTPLQLCNKRCTVFVTHCV